MSHNSHSHWSPNRDNDNPFEKYKSQRNASTDLPGFRASRRSRHSKSKVLKALGALFTLGVLLVVWQSSIGGALYGHDLGSLDSSGEHTSAGSGRDLTTEKGGIVKNNPQVGKEKASLVMLVRYACSFSFRHQNKSRFYS